SDAVVVVFGSDEHTLATIDRDNTARLWNTETGQSTTILHQSNTTRSVMFSPYGRTLAVLVDDEAVRLRSAATGYATPILDFTSGFGLAGAVVFSPDRRTVATIGRSGRLRLWSVPTP